MFNHSLSWHYSEHTFHLLTDKTVIVQTLIRVRRLSHPSVWTLSALFRVVLGSWWWLTAVTVTLMTAESRPEGYGYTIFLIMFLINFSFSLHRDFNHKGVGMHWSDTRSENSMLCDMVVTILGSKRTKKNINEDFICKSPSKDFV